MMQTLRVNDVLRCVLLNVPKGPNLACPRESLPGNHPASNMTVWRETLARGQNRVTFTHWDGNHLSGLASARVRRGHRAWEVDRMYLSVKPAQESSNGHQAPVALDAIAAGLLEQIMQAAGEHRAERIFLRLPAKSSIVTLVRQAGFFPYYEETLLEGPGGDCQADDAGTAAQWQTPLPEDDYALFQLFSAATPQTVRAAVGLTFDQWQDAGETRCERRQHWVVKTNGRIVGWLGFYQCREAPGVEVQAHPNHPELWNVLVERALSQGGIQNWLVPDYQEMVTELLLRRKFHEAARYTMMIKTVAVPVATVGMAPVEA